MRLIWQDKAQSLGLHSSPNPTQPSQMPSTAPLNHHTARSPIHRPSKPSSHSSWARSTSYLLASPPEDFLAPGDPLALCLDKPEIQMDALQHPQPSKAPPRGFSRPKSPCPWAHTADRVVEPSNSRVASPLTPETQQDYWPAYLDDIEFLPLGPPLIPVPGSQRNKSPDCNYDDSHDEAPKRLDQQDGFVEGSHLNSATAEEVRSAETSSRRLLARTALRIANRCTRLLDCKNFRKPGQEGVRL